MAGYRVGVKFYATPDKRDYINSKDLTRNWRLPKEGNEKKRHKNRQGKQQGTISLAESTNQLAGERG
jgi:hypothetical protein